MWSLSREQELPMIREITPVVRDEETINQLEAKLRTVPNFLPAKYSLWDVLSAPNTVGYAVDDVGLLIAVNVTQGKMAEVHITFWDGILEGREHLCWEVAQMLMASADLQFVLTFIPESRTRLLKFAKAIGFAVIEKQSPMLTLALLREGTEDGD